MPFTLRHPTDADHDALYHISVATGHSGKDAAPVMEDLTLIGAIYSVPYAELVPTWCWVAEDAEGVAGFVVGAPDTRSFENRIEAEWYPAIRSRTADPSAIPPAQRTPDQRELYVIHHPPRVPESVVTRFPAHLHMNALPRARGSGLGRLMFDTWARAARRRGVDGVHIGASPDNTDGIAFWAAMGFERLPPEKGNKTVWMGQRLSERY